MSRGSSATRRAAALLARAAFVVLLLAPAGTAGATPQLPYGEALGRAYDAVLDARFDAVEPELQKACGPAPPETCELVRVTALWWRIQLDPYSRSLDAQFRQRVDASIAAIERWTEREPRRADAWLFLGAAYGVRVQFRVLRVERLAAARDGKRVKDALEKSLSLDPKLQDAYFGIGVYHYYADLAPAVLKVVRWLLFLPGGNRAQGMKEMLQAADRGELLRGEANYQIALIYLWYEQNAEGALKLLQDLRLRYPHNPIFIQTIAEVQNVYLHDHAASLETWRAMFDLARQRKLALPEMSETRARLGMAEELDELGESDYAIEQLRPIVETRPTAPFGVVARAATRLGMAYDRLGQRTLAVPAYQLALSQTAAEDPYALREGLVRSIRTPPDPRSAEANRLSLEGWRHLQRKELAAAGDALSRAVSLRPADPVARYRLARLLLAREADAEALAALEQVLAAKPVAPPPILAAACLEAARLVEPSDRSRAIDLYRRVLRVRGAEAETKRAAQQSLARLRASLTHP
jgi:tetratricopeptide (TPR) repeat protein